MKKTVALISAAVMIFVLCACGPAKPAGAAPAADGKKQMTIAFCTWAGYAPLFIAQEKGYFDSYNYDVDIVIIEDESTYGAAFVSDSIQGLGQVLDRDIIQYDAGAPEQYV